MAQLRFTIGVDRAVPIKDCLTEVGQWPGCETIKGIAVLGESGGSFMVKIIDYGFTKKRLADRVAGCVQREKRRYPPEELTLP